jgi:hypothetical protein
LNEAEWNSLGEVDSLNYVAPEASKPASADVIPGSAAMKVAEDNSMRNLFFGLLLGLFAYLAFVKREKWLAVIASFKGSK